MADPHYTDRGANEMLNVIHVPPGGKATEDTRHLIYPWAIKGVNKGRTATGDISTIALKRFYDAAYRIFDERGTTGSEAQIRNLVAQWLWKGNNELAPNKIIEVPTENVLKLFHQQGEKGVKAWYDLNTRTFGAITGASDFSSFAHETWHDWTQSLSEDHISRLEKYFGDRSTTEYQERGARAFERYLRDGVAPSPELIPLFQSIRDAMVNIYRKLRGTPIEGDVHPHVRQVFDEILGKPAQTTPAQTTPAQTTPEPSLTSPTMQGDATRTSPLFTRRPTLPVRVSPGNAGQSPLSAGPIRVGQTARAKDEETTLRVESVDPGSKTVRVGAFDRMGKRIATYPRVPFDSWLNQQARYQTRQAPPLFHKRR